MSEATGGAVRGCTLLGVDVSIATGGFGAPVAGEVSPVGRLMEFNDKDLDPNANFHGSVLRYG